MNPLLSRSLEFLLHADLNVAASLLVSPGMFKRFFRRYAALRLAAGETKLTIASGAAAAFVCCFS